MFVQCNLINTIHSLMILVVASGGSRSAVQDIQPCHNLERNSQPAAAVNIIVVTDRIIMVLFFLLIGHFPT